MRLTPRVALGAVGLSSFRHLDPVAEITFHKRVSP